MRARDARVTLDFGDVAVLDLPARLGVPRHLPFEVHLDFRNPVDDALVFQVIGASEPLGSWYQPRSMSSVQAPSSYEK